MSAPIELADEVARLRACLSNLISVAALPALSTGREPTEIVGPLADGLLETLGLAFVLVRLNESEREQPIELARIAESFRGTIRQHDISETTLTREALSRPLHDCVLLGGVDFTIASAQLGLGGELGVVIAGSRNLGFPAQTERLLLDVAATEAAIALRQVRLLSQQRRAAEELDECALRRASELAAVNKRLAREVAEPRRWEDVESIPGMAATLTATGEVEFVNRRLLQFLAAGELLEADFWTQYNELGGIQDSEVSGGAGNVVYTERLRSIDRNCPQYIHDNADDEISHATFINAYLVSRGAEPVSLDRFRALEGSKATGSSGKARLTNLMELTIDSSWWTRYRSSTNNPDVNPTIFEQAVPDLHSGQHTAIPRTDDDLYPHAHIQAIANTAAFQMPTVEQGGGSLRMALAQRATDVEVLRLLISMGPIESMHFQTWHEKAGKVRPLTDPTNGLTFPDLNSGIDPNTGARGSAIRQMFQTNLIMPEPCPFISTSLPACSIVRPTNTTGAATGALKFLTAMGLFIGQSQDFFNYLTELASAADAAQRGI